MAAAIDDLQEELAHSGIDGVANQVGIHRFKDGFAGQYFGGHGGAVGHAGAAQGFDEGFLDDAVLDIERQLAGALLGRAPAHAVGKAADILDLLRFDPLSLLGDGSRIMLRAFSDAKHLFNFV